MSEIQFVFKVLQLTRLMRVVKLARYFHGMEVMLRRTRHSLGQIGPFALLLFLFIYLFALVGRELFAYKAMLDPYGELIYGEEVLKEYDGTTGHEIHYPRINFNSLYESNITVFILINGEDWIWVAQDWIRAYGDGDSGKESVARIYFVIVMLFGNLTLFALFTGVLLHNFKMYEVQTNSKKKKTFIKFIRQVTIKLMVKVLRKAPEQLEEESEENKEINDLMNR